MHKHFVLNVIGRILLVVSAIMVIPMIWAMRADIHNLETHAFEGTIIFGILLGALFISVFPIKKLDYKRINAKDGLAIVGLSWIMLSAVGALPLYITGVVDSYTDAYFEIASGFTTTGATIFTDVESLPVGILFWRSLTHWLGGMGIIVLFIALLPALGASTSQLYKAEAPGLTVERADPRIQETAKNLWSVYFLLSFLETGFLMFGGMSFFDSLCHTFGTMATGGFSTKNASVAVFSPYIQWVIIVFMFLAGVNFILHYQLLRGRFRTVIKNEEFKVYAGLTLAFITIFTVVLSWKGISAAPVRDATFQIVAILTTTGFVTVDFDLWPNALRFMLVMLMFVGGCGGSTGGGMKVIRFMMAIKIGLRSIAQAAYPNLVSPIKSNGNPVSEKIITGAVAYFIIFVTLLVFGTAIFCISESTDLVTAFTANVSALSNIGPGLGDVGATKNFAWVSPFGKWLLVFLMFAGRLELYSILILFLPSTWRK